LFLQNSLFILSNFLGFRCFFLSFGKRFLQKIKLDRNEQIHHEESAKDHTQQEVRIKVDVVGESTHLVHVVGPAFQANNL